MKTLAALALVLVCAACAPAGNSAPKNAAFNDGIANQENRTALSLFYGDYTVVSQNGDAIAGTDDALTCSTDATIANSVATYPISGGGGDYAMETFTDANGDIVKSDDIWISPGVLYYSDALACSDFHMYVFEDRGKWRMGKDFVEYTFDGTLTRNDGEQVTFDSSLRADRLSDGQVQVQMHSKTSDGEFSGTWVLAPR
jgi:hypothetical protein